jgi:hypothetical protein
MTSQSSKNLNRNSFETPWESWDKKPLRCGCHEKAHSILYGGRWWLPLSLSHGESYESKVTRGLLSTKGAPENELTNLLVDLMQVRVSE